MPEIEIEIGDRKFEVACQEGEEHYLKTAAKMLDEEAKVLTAQIGRIPDSRMLLMAGLMLADKTAGLQDKLAEKEAELSNAGSGGAVEQVKVEVPVVPDGLLKSLGDLATRTEAIANTVDKRVSEAK